MIWIVIGLILFIVILLFVILIKSKVQIYLECIYDDEERCAFMRASLFGIHIVERTIPLKQEDGGNWEKNILVNWKRMKKELDSRKKIMKKIKIRELTWKTEFGTGDAATAGIAAGGLWSMKGMIISQAYRFFSFKGKPDLQVFPDFHQSFFDSRMYCIGTITVGQAILAYMQIPSTKNK
ncbi:DUF2953 domain-containing protein [Aciduricibacillus chroicocephali]|uniref:DUF2953 domain-containing protein n=1 Tax=Aciduricibacillus chroicocephali TaxID=3054939 RepID=A0ABY9KU56_9BACI|nr:DUF2953 domain-containing protein [Bacillaceae bacterium 44XB]